MVYRGKKVGPLQTIYKTLLQSVHYTLTTTCTTKKHFEKMFLMFLKGPFILKLVRSLIEDKAIIAVNIKAFLTADTKNSLQMDLKLYCITFLILLSTFRNDIQ